MTKPCLAALPLVRKECKMFKFVKISLLLLILTTIFSSQARAECPPGDLDDNCRVNLEDLRIFAEQWLSKESTQANLDGIGGINAYDYALLAKDWLKRGIPLRINEFMASNNSVYEDPDNTGEYPDWIEIYNAGDEAIDMSGMYLTDNLNNPTQWQIPGGVVLAADDYLVILADLLNYQGAALHTNFKLGAGGEQIGLFHSNSITEIDSIDFDQVEQYTDISYGLDANDTLRFFGVPTPDAENNDAYLGLVADTVFSRDRGFYDTAFSVELECETPGAEIYYRVDFNKPDKLTGMEYTGPIAITETTCLRAMAFKAGWKPTNVDTHTYIFPDNVAAQTTAQAVARGFPDPWVHQYYIELPSPPGIDYGPVSPSDYEVESTLNGSVEDFKEQLKAIPTMSIVTEMDDMWQWDHGYYVNSWLDGIAWEREASVEYFDAAGNEEFQINCAIRAQGNQNRRPYRTPKHSMRLRFKSDYGPSKLRYPLFKDSDVETFDSLTLRGGCADSWHQYGASRASYTRDGWTHRSMHEVGQFAPHGNYVHLYLNGLYWGLYNPIERPDASFYAEHVGIGEREDWEANNQGDPMGDDTPADLVVWNTIMGMCTGTFLSTTFNDTQYDDLSEWLDMPAFCDYLLVNFYGSTKDWGKWNFYAGALPGEPGQPPLIKLRFSTWDAEEGLGLWGPPWDTTGPCLGHTCADRGVIKIYSRLMGNAKFQNLLADRAYKWLYNGAPLDNQNCIDRWLELAAQIGDAIIGESARWGDVDFSTGTQSLWDYWIGDMAGSFYFGSRRDTVIGQLRSRGLYPSINPPIYSQHGGYVPAGYSLTMTNPNGSGTIYYTLNGSEPRDSGSVYSGAVTLNESTLVKARVLKSGEWSALNEVAFGIGPIADNLRITEMMYHPADAPLGDPNAEFIEVKNVGGTALKLNLVKFTEGIHFTFPSMTLAAGDYAIVVKDAAVFTVQYPYPTFSGVIAGEYVGSLDNGGERVRLEDAVGGTVLEFRYRDDWRPITDGVGYSLTVMDEAESDPSIWDDKQGWDASTYIGGTPGEFDDGPRTGDIEINELLAHSDGHPNDWIELHNTTASPIDITGWFLSDSDANLLKYEIPSTTIPANGYVVLTEDDHFGSEFAFSENGETVYLTSGFDGYGHLTGYRRTEDFDASENSVSFGRYQKSDGTHNFVAMASQTPGAVNSGPKVGPVVINEIMYHPDIVGTAEFVELYNITGSTVNLYDPGIGGNVPWKFTDDGGIDCNMPPGASIPAGGYLLLVRDLADFEAEYSAPGGVQRVEWPLGKLSNSGEKLEISRPGDRNELTGERYYIRVDRVVYSDGFHPEGEDPWPPEPDGQNGDGSSLHRKVPGNYGNDVINWQALTPTPGT